MRSAVRTAGQCMFVSVIKQEKCLATPLNDITVVEGLVCFMIPLANEVVRMGYSIGTVRMPMYAPSSL